MLPLTVSDFISINGGEKGTPITSLLKVENLRDRDISGFCALFSDLVDTSSPIGDLISHHVYV